MIVLPTLTTQPHISLEKVGRMYFLNLEVEEFKIVSADQLWMWLYLV